MRKFKLLIILIFSVLGSGYSQDLYQVNNKYSAAFDAAYTACPEVPRGLLEAVAFTNTRFNHVIPDSDVQGCMDRPATYGVMGLIEDGKGYFKNNLKMVSMLSGISEAEIKNSPSKSIMAYALSYQNLLHQLALRSSSVESQVPLIVTLSELPNVDAVSSFAANSNVYSVLSFLNDFQFQKKYSFPEYHIDLRQVFGDRNYDILSSGYVALEGNRVSSSGETFDPSAGMVTASADYAPALWDPAPTCNYSSRNGVAISAVTVHDTEGSYAGCISWFKNCSASVSAHYVLRSSDGQITQMVREYDKAWHVGSENPYTIGLEHEGYKNQTGWYTTAMYTASANLVKDICNSGYGILPTTCYNGPSCTNICVLSSSVKIKGHQHYPNQNHTDPGPNWNWSTYYNLINGTTAVCNTPGSLSTTNITASAATASWASVSGATSYQVRIRAVGATTWSAYSTTSTSYAFSALSGSKQYEWQVSTVCSSTSSSAFSTSVTFTTLAPSTCGTPTGLTVGSVYTSTAKASWQSVSGATGYVVRIKSSTATSWTSYSVTGTSYSFSNLAASTTYSVVVAANCSGVISANSAAVSFTTKASCYDAYEPNGSSSSATAVGIGGTRIAKICGSGDIDWYVVTLTATANLKFTLSNLPADYDIELYVNGAYVTGSYNSGTTNEAILRSSQPAGSYYFRVYGPGGVYNSLKDYTATVTSPSTATSAPGSGSDDEIIAFQQPDRTLKYGAAQGISAAIKVTMYPNPANNQVSFSTEEVNLENSVVEVYNLNGQLVVSSLLDNSGTVQLDKLQTGLYFIHLISNDAVISREKLQVIK